MAAFNMALPGNTAADYISGRGTLPAAEAHYLAIMALAAEQRTANLIAYSAANPATLTEGLDIEIRKRLGMKP